MLQNCDTSNFQNNSEQRLHVNKSRDRRITTGKGTQETYDSNEIDVSEDWAMNQSGRDDDAVQHISERNVDEGCLHVPIDTKKVKINGKKSSIWTQRKVPDVGHSKNETTRRKEATKAMLRTDFVATENKATE